MGKYLAPLGIFVTGMVFALILFLFLPTIGDSADQLATDSAAYSSVFWNWGIFVNGNFVKFLVFFIVIMGTLFATAKAFLRVK